MAARSCSSSAQPLCLLEGIGRGSFVSVIYLSRFEHAQKICAVFVLLGDALNQALFGVESLIII